MTKNTLFHWTHVYDGEVYDADFSCMNAAIKAADEWWVEKQSENENMRNGEIFEAEIDIIAYRYDDEGERKIFTTVEHVAVYEHYHGDLAEHGTGGM